MTRQSGDVSRPRELAAQTGISLRYVQKLLAERCYIYPLRLDQTARLLHHRVLLSTGEPLSEIGYACGSRDYTPFAREFLRRIDYAPRAYAEGHGRAGDGNGAGQHRCLCVMGSRGLTSSVMAV